MRARSQSTRKRQESPETPEMPSPLNADELKRLETFFTTCLSDPGSMGHDELLEAISENQELCTRALGQLSAPAEPDSEAVTEADLNFLESWLKARNLILGGMQLLKMADEQNAAAIQHELDCTETAFTLIPRLIADART